MKLEYRHLNWMQLIWDTDLDTKSKITAAYLTTHMNKDHHIVWPSIARIAEKTGQSDRTVIRAVANLQEKGWLSVERGGPNKGSSRYAPVFPEIVEKLLVTSGGGVTESPRGVTQSPDVVSESHTNQSNRISPKKKDARERAAVDKSTKKKLNGSESPRRVKANPGQAEIQISKCRFPDRLSKLCRHHGFGDPPAGMAFEQAKAWALRKAQESARQEKN